MGLQFEQVTYAPAFSLTQIVEDTAYLRREGNLRAVASGIDPEAWINALQLQSRPLIQSGSPPRRPGAWLAAADAATGE